MTKQAEHQHEQEQEQDQAQAQEVVTTRKTKETVYDTIKMDDDRLVDFPAKRKLLKNAVINPNGTIDIRLDFVNGETRLYPVPQDLLLKFAAHGALQKLGDEIAGLDNIEDCVMAVDALTDRLNKGEWEIKREVGATMAGSSILARALAEKSGKSLAEVKTFLLAKTHAQKVALRQNPAIAPIIAKLEADRKPKKGEVKIDTDALLGELG